MKYKPLMILLAPLALGACASQVPMPATYPISYQQKMQAAHHWNVLASDVVSQMSESVGTLNRAIYVAEANAPTDFNQGFRNLLQTELLANGYTVTRAPVGNAVTLEYDVQAITHNDRGYIRSTPGLYTALAGGVLVLNNLAHHQHLLTGGAALLGAGVAADVVTGHHVKLPNTEVIINTSIVDGDRYVVRQSGIYYINDADLAHYHYTAPAVVPETFVKRVGVVND